MRTSNCDDLQLGLTVNAADCLVSPVESTIVKPIDVPSWMLTIQVKLVPVRPVNCSSAGAEGWLPGSIL